MLMHILKEQGLNSEIDIKQAILNVRAQRSGMVQTEVDLFFCSWFTITDGILKNVSYA
jgi:hypothetical protein